MATPTFTKKEVDIEALMAQAAALEAEAAAGKDKGKKEKPPKVKKEKEKKEKPPRAKKEKAPKEAKPKAPKKDKPAKESKPAKERKEKKTDKKKSKKNASLTTRKVFGVPVSELEVEESELPEIYMTLISALESYATETQGLFRIAAAKAEVDALVARFEGGEDIDWANYEDKHLVGGVLMEFLLRMPEPLITYEVYHKLIKAYQTEPELEKKYQKCRTLLKELPELNFNMLEHLMDFLDTMTRDADDNLMTAANLAICFGPGLMRRLEDDITLILKDTPFINEIITSLIEQYGFYFRGEEIDKSHNTAAGVAAGSTTNSSPALNKQSSGADYSAFVGVALNGLNALSKELAGIIADLGWGKLWKPLGLAHLFVLEDLLKKLIGDEIVKLSVDDVQNEIEDSLESYMDEVENKGTEDACAFLKAAMQKHQSYISDTIVVLANQQAERELVLSSCRLSNNGKLLLEHLQPNIKRDMAVSVSDISQVQETVPKILKLMNELKVGMNTCTDYSAAVLISRVVRGVQKALKDKSKAPIAEVDLNLPPSDPSPKDKAKIQSLQDALEFSFPACDKVLSSILDATKDPEKKSEAIRDADLLMELFGLLEKVSKILKKQAAAPPPIAPHPAAVKTNTPPPLSPHPATAAPPPVSPHPRVADAAPPVSPNTRPAPPPSPNTRSGPPSKPAVKSPSGGIKTTPPPVAAHPRGTPGAKPPPISPHPASGGAAPPPVAPHPRAGAAPPPVAPHPKNTNAPPPVAPHPRAGAAPPPVAPHPRTMPKNL